MHTPVNSSSCAPPHTVQPLKHAVDVTVGRAASANASCECKHTMNNLHVAVSAMDSLTSTAHSEHSASSSAAPASQARNSVDHAVTPEAAATASSGLNSSADFVLTAPDTHGKPQVVEKVYLASPSQMLAADTSAALSESCGPAAGLDVYNLQPAVASHAQGHEADLAHQPEAVAAKAGMATEPKSATSGGESVNCPELPDLALGQVKRCEPLVNIAIAAGEGHRLAEMPVFAHSKQDVHTQDPGELKELSSVCI